MEYTREQLQKMMDENDGSLYLSYTQITSLPDNLTVGGSLYLSNTKITSDEKAKVNRLKNGDYLPNRYLYCDGILTHIKHKRTIKGYTYFIGKIQGQNVIYDGANYAHCKSLKEGIIDLEFKKAQDRGAEQYKNLTLNSVVKKDDAIVMYRIITGACQQGTQNFLNSLKEIKEEYTVAEIINLTKNQYGAEVFKKFFEDR